MISSIKLNINTIHNINRSAKKTLLLFLVTALLVTMAVQANAKEKGKDNHADPIEVYGIGNGCMASRPDQSAFRGWMQLLPMFFPADIHFEDYTRSGESVREFVRQGRWERIKEKLRENDYVLVSFNEKDQGPQVNKIINKQISKILDDIQAKKAHGIVIGLGFAASAKKTATTAISAPGSKMKLQRAKSDKTVDKSVDGNIDRSIDRNIDRSIDRTNALSHGQVLGYHPLYLNYTYDSIHSNHDPIQNPSRFNSTGKPQTAAIFLSRPLTDSGLLLYDAICFAKKMSADLKKIIRLNDSDKSSDKSSDYSIAFKSQPSPSVWTDLIARNLKLEAALDFHKNRLPATAARWKAYAPGLREKLMRLCGAKTYHHLDLDIHETGRLQQKGYSIRKIYFQTRPGIYATANLYVPDGKGPFPAIINMHGHWPDGKAGEMVASCAASLALNGYVCLNMDAWGAGERTSFQNEAEYHGSNLGASLMDIGETLLGNQVADNMRGVDLLSSLDFVDSSRIGATGASGGGNQTMWLAAMDTRIKACMPVVSVGTFQSYIMGSNCVCELMPAGLTCTEESGVIGLIAPRAIMICSALQDANPAFSPVQMLRTFHHAEHVFGFFNQTDHIRYQLFNTTHGYHPEMRSAMLGWFDAQLKGQGQECFKPEKPFELTAPENLAVFQGMQRDRLITTTIAHVRKAGAALKANLRSGTGLNPAEKRASLKSLLMLPLRQDQLDSSYAAGEVTDDKNRVWQTGTIITTNRHMISYKYLPAIRPGGRILLVCAPDSAIANGQGHYREDFILNNFGPLMDSCLQAGEGLLIADIWGLGASGSAMGRKVNGRLPLFHTVARAALWMGRTVMGEWVSDLQVLAGFIHHRFRPAGICLAAGKEVAVAALAENALYDHFDELYLSDLPVSYVVDKRSGIDYFNMGIHIPHFLNWGDVSVMAALNKDTKITLHHPVTMTGSPLDGDQKDMYRKEFAHFNSQCQGQNLIVFN